MTEPTMNEQILETLQAMHAELRLIRLATYGQTPIESGETYEDPKHGNFGATGQATLEIVAALERIEAALDKRGKSGPSTTMHGFN